MRPRDSAIHVALVLLAVSTGGCSFSDSSESISKSVSSPFESSSDSSSPDDSDSADVRDFTAAYVRSGGDADDLRREITKLAAKHGITDWEASESTYQGIGAGLAKAGYRQVQVDAFKTNLAKSPQQAAWLQHGYDSTEH